MRHLAHDPRHIRRVYVDTLEAILEQQKLALLAESLMAPAMLGGDAR
jgi:hypothetical protein